jgi:uncharacterized phage protein (TIGR01671 family)
MRIKMRTIKFRAWDEKSQTMYYSDNFGNFPGYVYFLHNEWMIELAYEDGCHGASVPVKHLMQFTGLLDQNGKEIYEGDICRYFDQSGKSQIGVVTDYGYFSGYIKAIGGDEEGNQDIELHPSIPLEHVGNLYETPELLEDGKCK